MAEWPKLRSEYRRAAAFSTTEEYTRRSGRQPSLADLTYPAFTNGCIVPLWIPHPFLAKRIGVFNGTVVNGNHAVAVACAALAMQVVFAAQAGVSQIQWFDLSPDLYLPPGWISLMHATDSTTARFQSLQPESASGEKNFTSAADGTQYPPGTIFSFGETGIVPAMILSGLAA